jgi:hypothetical protein
MKRPIRPPQFEPQPESIEPTDKDIEEAFAIARLVGYLNVAMTDYLPGLNYSLLNCVNDEIGAVIVWQLAGTHCDYLAVARQAAQEATAKSRSESIAVCNKYLPLLVKHKYFWDSDESERIARTWQVLSGQ